MTHAPIQIRWPIGLSIAAALATMALKVGAAWITGSVGLLADALESLINLLAAATAYGVLWYASRPADKTHTFGHEKIEYFASGLEGGLILLAGAGTILYAVRRWLQPQPLQELEWGTAIAAAAAIINLVVARILLYHGRRTGSIVLEADGKHLMSDVWTSAGVLAGLALVLATGLEWLDPLLAVAVGANIAWTGLELIWRSFQGLMDHALPAAEQEQIRSIIRGHLPTPGDFHMLRTRRSGQRRFAEFHLLLPGDTPVRTAHEIAHRIEHHLRQQFPGIEVMAHVEPIEEACAWETEQLRQLGESPPAPPAPSWPPGPPVSPLPKVPPASASPPAG